MSGLEPARRPAAERLAVTGLELGLADVVICLTGMPAQGHEAGKSAC